MSTPEQGTPGARRGKLLTLEVARFIAAFCVALEHLGGNGMINHLGPRVMDAPAPAAVMFFFTLSGFVIYTAHWQDAGRPRRLPRYFWRRFWRIYPIYWLAMAPVLALLWRGCSTPYLINNFTLMPNTPNDFHELVPPAWTLRYEMTFYILFGLSLLPVLRRVVLPFWFVLLVWVWYGFHLHLPALPGWMVGQGGIKIHVFSLFNFMFFAGVAAGAVFVRRMPPKPWRWALLGLGAAGTLLMLHLADNGNIYPTVPLMPVTAVSYALLVLALAMLERGGQIRIGRRWAILGTMSYPLYLIHTVIGLRFNVYIAHHPWAQHFFSDDGLFFTLLAVSLLSAWLIAVLFDQPLQRLIRRVM